ncbi:MAG: ATP-binding protein, partial [Pseudomonadales bacterium]|nr:ATP-binding protein [Pseudomonadales bacterium]
MHYLEVRLSVHWVFNLWLIILSSCLALTATAGDQSVSVKDLEDGPIHPTIWYFEDNNDTLTLERAQQYYQQGRFHKEDANFNFGYSRSTYWFMFNFQLDRDPRNALPQDIILEFRYPHIDHFEIYRSAYKQPPELIATLGDKTPFKDRPITSHNFVLSDHINGNQRYYYWIKLETSSSTQLRPSIWNKDTYLETSSESQMAWGLYFGILIVMAIYNLFLGISIKDKTYFFYVGYIISFIILQACILGYSYQYLWPSFPQINNYAIPNFILLAMAFTSLFSQSFLQTQHYSPRCHRILHIITLCSFCLVLLNFFISYPLRVALAIWLSLFATIGILGAAVVVLRKGQRFARLYLVAWSILLIGAVTYGFYALGIVPGNFVTRHASQIGAAIEVILLSFALADRINRIKAEKRELEKRSKAILESKNAELENTLALLRRSNTLKDEFLATISHELRTPMNGIEGSLQIVRQSIRDSDANQHLDAASQSAHHMTQLVESLLEYSELQSGNWKANKQPFKLERLINKCSGGVVGEYANSPIEFSVEGQTKLPHYLIGDVERIEHMLFQLLDNAFKFTHQGKVTLTVEPLEKDDHVEVSFKVADTGIGIPETKLDEIFESFRQADGSFSRQYGGLGIGLSLCKAIADGMGGELQADSKPGIGSNFVIRLTFEKGTAIEAPKNKQQRLPNNYRILVVEDNLPMTNLIKSVLMT